MKRKLLLTVLIFTLLALAIYVGVSRLGGNRVQEGSIPPSSSASATSNDTFKSPTPEPINEKPKVTPFKQTAWIPDWDFWNGFNSLKANAQYFHSVSPVWYYLDDNGNVKTNRIGLSEIRSFTKAKGIKLIPSIGSFDSDQIRAVLADPKKLEAHISFFKSEVEKYDYDGLDIDHESFFFDDKPEYTHLIRSLYDYLDSKGKMLTVAVVPNWTDSKVHKTFKQTRAVQDWYELGQYVHELRIMTYNLTDDNARYPGPLAPIDWMAANLRYARMRVDMSKVVLGLHLYSYGGWGNNPTVISPYLGGTTNVYEGSRQAAALTYSNIPSRRQTASKDLLEEDTLEKRLEYTRGGRKEIAYYMDREAAAHRFALGRAFGAAGIAHWRMGSEDQSIYKLVLDD